MLTRFSPQTIARGKRYLVEGRVGTVSWDPDAGWLIASVQGTRMYQVTWSWVRGRWQHGCTCPVGSSCKHAYAVGLHFANQAMLDASPRDWLKSGMDLTQRETPLVLNLTESLMEAHGRELKKAEASAVATVERLFVQLDRDNYLDPYEIEDLARLFPGVLREVRFRDEEIEDVFDTENPPRSSLEFWQHVATLYRSRGWRLPALFAPVTETKPIEARMAARRHERHLAAWAARLERLEEDAAAAAAAERRSDGRLSIRLKIGAAKVTFQEPVVGGTTSEGFRDLTRADLEASDSPHGIGQLAHRLDAPSALLLGLFRRVRDRHGWSKALRLSDPEVNSAVSAAIVHPDLHDRVVNESGAPFVRSEGRLVWEFLPDPKQPGTLLLRLQREDGNPVAPSVRYLGGPPHVYLLEGTVFAGPPPLRDGGDASWTAQIPAEVLEKPSVVRSLVASGSRLPESVTQRIRRIALRPHLRVWLERDGAQGETVRAVFSAVDEDGKRHLVWTPSGWSRDFRDAPADETEGGAIVSHVTSELAAATAAFDEAPVSWNREHGMWSRPVHDHTADELSVWFMRFPEEMRFELAPEIAGLRDAPTRAELSLKLNESGRDWFDVELVVKPADTELTPGEVDLLAKARGRWVRLDGKGWRRLALEASAEQTARLEQLGLSAEGPPAGKQKFHALQLAAADLEGIMAADCWREVSQRAGAIRAVPTPPIPSRLKATLRPYQVEGFHFLSHLSANSLGGILADDMGLGKTVMALAWFLRLMEELPAGRPLRALVVCPKSVVTNWEREAARFTPALRVARFDPSTHTALPDVHLLTANYAQVRLSDERFLKVDWTAVVLDEGQFIKNPNTKTAQVARKLRAEHRLVLSGTPIENHLLDLWSLFAFAMPGLLGGQAQFKKSYNDKRDPGAPGRLARRVKHFMLRRTKAQVAEELPARTEEDVLFDLEGEQEKLYQAELKQARRLVLGVAGKREFDAQRMNILQSLLRLRQICCHPGLLGDEFAGARSAKLDALFEQLEPILAEGHKVLIFSQFVSMLKIVRAELEARSIGHLLITGQTENRQELVDRFQTDASVPVFLLSLKAAGVGLNLTAASYVVLFDPWWNPAVEAQAIDRTHRIGQQSHVIAYRLIARGTVEEKIRRMQQEKAALAKSVVQEESLSTVLDLEALRYVLG